MGHLAADVDCRQTPNDKLVATFPLATNRFKTGEDGNKKEVVDFHRIVAWGGLGKICGDYLSKGMPVYVEGRIINRSFEAKDGSKQYRTEIIADELNILVWNKGVNKDPDSVGLQPVLDGEEEVAIV